MFWTRAFAGVTPFKTFYEIIKLIMKIYIFKLKLPVQDKSFLFIRCAFPLEDGDFFKMNPEETVFQGRSILKKSPPP